MLACSGESATIQGPADTGPVFGADAGKDAGPTVSPDTGPPPPPDEDGDGAVDSEDNCPQLFNPNQGDQDGDGKGDACDSCVLDALDDQDGDGVCGDVDRCPETADPDQSDTDGDGQGDACEVCPADPVDDADGDGVCGDVDNCAELKNDDQEDGDGDGLGDLCDLCPADPLNDTDGDGTCGDTDTCPDAWNPNQADSDVDGAGDACDECPFDAENDTDADGVCGDVDNCVELKNADQTDSDGDSAGDVCDACPLDAENDLDSDGVCGDVDLCPADADPDQEDFDEDGLGDFCDICPLDANDDEDGDAVCGQIDNCPQTYNPNQGDQDADNLGDACEICGLDPDNDVDEDGVCGDVDSCPGHKNADQLDSDGDGVGDVCDSCPEVHNPGQEDKDNNDVGDACEDEVPPPPDGDKDGIPDAEDNCPEVHNPGQEDADKDEVGDACDTVDPPDGEDLDGDGVANGEDNCPAVPNPGQLDADKNEVGDHCEAPVVSEAGATDRYRLQGMIVTPDVAFEGEVLVVGDAIACVSVACDLDPEAAGATVINTHGIIYPGFIDTHNHILFDVFNNDDWLPSKAYENHNQWPNEASYKLMKAASEHLISSSEGAGLKCEVQKYGEIKGLLGGSTSILGAPKGSPQKCYQSLARSIDGQFNDLPDMDAPPFPEPEGGCTAPASADHIQTAVALPTASGVTSVLANFDTCKTWAYVAHVAEGVPTNASAYNEWTKLVSLGLEKHQVTVVHGTALGLDEFNLMADAQMNLTWSPRSNIALYDFSTQIDLALQTTDELNISLAPDWSMGGSSNLLDELNFAHAFDVANWGEVLSAKQLTRMVTINPAKALGLDHVLGSIEEGKLADLVVLSGDTTQPWEALIAARPSQVQMVMVNGVILLGAPALQSASALPDCETVDICGNPRFICVAEPTKGDQLDQTLEQITTSLNGALMTFDEANGSSFHPVAPLVTCP